MCAEVLIRHGADKLQRDEKGRIPYDYIGMKNSDYIWNAKGTYFFPGWFLLTNAFAFVCSFTFFVCGCSTFASIHS